MHGFTHLLVSTETERDVTNAATYVGMRQIFTYPSRGTKEINCIIAVFFDTCRNRKNIGIENYVLRGKFYVIDKYIICSFADGNSAFIGISLSILIKCHHYNGRPISS